MLGILAAGAALAQTTIDKPVATVNLIRKEVVSQRQLKADVEKIENASGQKLTIEQRREVLDGRVDIILFNQYCEREKITVADGDITKAVDQLRQQLGTGMDDVKLETALRSQGIILDARSYVKQQLLLKRYLQLKKADDLKAVKAVTADEILQAYELQKSQLVRPDTVRVSVLYVDYRATPADQKKKAQDALRQAASQLRSNPSRFDELLLKASDADSLYKSATFYVYKNPQSVQAYGQAFVDQVFKMKVGDVSDILETTTIGMQVVRVNEFQAQKNLTLSDPYPGVPNATVQDYIRYALATKRQSDALAKIQKDLLAELHKSGTVTIYSENLNF